MGHRTDEALHEGNMEEFIGAVSVGLRAKDSSHHELSLWPDLAQEGQEGNRHSL